MVSYWVDIGGGGCGVYISRWVGMWAAEDDDEGTLRR